LNQLIKKCFQSKSRYDISMDVLNSVIHMIVT